MLQKKITLTTENVKTLLKISNLALQVKEIWRKKLRIILSIYLIETSKNLWKRGLLSKSLLAIKGRSCNQTLLVHQDMTKKTTF